MMEVNTDRLRMREVSSDDLDDIHELHSIPETDKYNTLGIPETIQVTEKIVDEWLAGQNEEPQTSYVLCLSLIATNRFIGLIAVNVRKPHYKVAEVWYKVHLDYWGKEYTTEALRSIINFGFNNLRLHRIEAGCAVENIASSRVLEKVGMVKEGMKRKKLLIRGQWEDNYFYSILDEDFLNSEQTS